MTEMAQVENAPELALAWHQAGRGAVLATVIETWGSAPRRVGSQLVIDAEGHFEGSVSGGCVEGAVIFEAQEALREGRAKVLQYGVSDGDAFAVGLACGGNIRILVEPVGAVLPEPLLQDLVAARAQKQVVGYLADLDGSKRALVLDGYDAAFRSGRSQVISEGKEFLHIHTPPLRLVIVGAVHIAQVLAEIARPCGFAPTIIDPRSGFAAPERFGDIPLLLDWPDEALSSLEPDYATALVLLTHDPKLDDPAIARALSSDVFYIGALGSKRTHAARRERLSAAGFDQEAIDRIHGPVGLDIGASNPAEIAVSILAEMIAVLRERA